MDDRISSLPEDVLCHILSFLPTKHVASTSVLSKRWRNLLAFVPILDFEDFVFLRREEGNFLDFEERDRIVMCFMDFVDRVLALQGDSLIEKFSLKRTFSGVPDRWIHNVLQRGVSELEILNCDFDDYMGNFYVPLEMFVSKKLAKLKLRRFWWPYEAKCIFLPMLKSLIINEGCISSATLEMLLHGFPVLEELVVSTVRWTCSNDTLSSASLKKLTIEAGGCPKSISFDTPSLLYLDYCGFVAEDYPKLNFANLVEARLRVFASEEHVKQIRLLNNDVILRFGNLWKLMTGIRNVQKLSLCSETLELLSLCSVSMPVFNNLKMLQLQRSSQARGWQAKAMLVLLKKSPHLETLLLEKFLTDECGDACDCFTREDKVCSLTSSRVKKIHVKGFNGTNREIEMIKHFLESFPCLKEMEIDAEEKHKHTCTVIMVKIYKEIHQSCDVRLLVSGSIVNVVEWLRKAENNKTSSQTEVYNKNHQHKAPKPEALEVAASVRNARPALKLLLFVILGLFLILWVQKQTFQWA